MRFLFVKQVLAWPRASGHDVYCYYLQRELAQLGHEVSLLTAAEPAPEAIAGLKLTRRHTFATAGPDDGRPLRLSRLQERYRSYWGIPPERVRAVARVAEECQADAVVAAGLEVLPYLGAVQGRCRIWYPADEWVWHHLSQVRLFDRSTWGEVKEALVKGLYERAYGPLLDRVWVVSDRDRRAMRWVSGVKGVEVLLYGVDAEHYLPAEGEEVPDSCAFWGRLDFGPNLQALEWFCNRVWPLVRREAPAARFTVYGFNPTAAALALAGRDGVTLTPNLPDLRPEVGRHQAVVMPFVSGGGVKNKLLEAASMGKAIVCSPHACNGLRLPERSPLLVARAPAEWVGHLRGLWADAGRRRQLGAEARRWVLEHHSWRVAAREAAAGLEGWLREARR